MKLTIKKTPLSSHHSSFNAENSRTLDSAAVETSFNTISSSASKHLKEHVLIFDHVQAAAWPLFQTHPCQAQGDVTFESRQKKVYAVASLRWWRMALRREYLRFRTHKNTKTPRTAESTSGAKCSVEKNLTRLGAIDNPAK